MSLVANIAVYVANTASRVRDESDNRLANKKGDRDGNL